MSDTASHHKPHLPPAVRRMAQDADRMIKQLAEGAAVDGAAPPAAIPFVGDAPLDTVVMAPFRAPSGPRPDRQPPDGAAEAEPEVGHDIRTDIAPDAGTETASDVEVSAEAGAEAEAETRVEAETRAEAEVEPLPADTPRRQRRRRGGEEAAGPSLSELQTMLAQAQHEAATWKGRHNAETRRLQEQIAALTRQIADMKAAAAPPLPDAPVITEDERASYGDDFLEVVGKQALLAVMPALKAMEARVAAQIDAMKSTMALAEETVSQAKKERFLARLDKEVPTWRQIEVQPEFMQWLQQYDPLLRDERKKVLDEAVVSGDVDATVALLRAFLDQQEKQGSRTGRKTPRGASGWTEAASAVAQPEMGAPTADLTQFAAPGRARSPTTAPPSRSPAKVWSLSEIQRVYADIARGVYRDDPARQRAIELEIASAQREGRVRV